MNLGKHPVHCPPTGVGILTLKTRIRVATTAMRCLGQPSVSDLMPPNHSSRGRQSGRNSSRNNKFVSRKHAGPESDDKAVEVEGEISSVLAGTMFRVKLASGHEVLAHISGKMRKRFIRLVVGDRVKMEMSPYDLSKARIVFRLG